MTGLLVLFFIFTIDTLNSYPKLFGWRVRSKRESRIGVLLMTYKRQSELEKRLLSRRTWTIHT